MVILVQWSIEDYQSEAGKVPVVVFIDCLAGFPGCEVESQDMNWKEHKNRLLEGREVRREYEALAPEYQLAAALIRLRLAKGLTQEQLAELLDTKQASIARLESGRSLPSLSTVRKVAHALDAELRISLRPKNQAGKDELVRIAG